MRSWGLGRYADELEVAMNRAAEAAVPQARALLADSIRKMSFDDAKGILTGGDDAATRYFRRTTAAPLAEKFKPIVRKAIAKVKLAEKYEQFAGTAARFGLIKEEDSHLDSYVTGKALDGLYLMIAEEEKAIRKDPLGAAGRLAKKVFGALRQ
jgi:tRNA(Ile)-lysidine synthase TilS/MesJ